MLTLTKFKRLIKDEGKPIGHGCYKPWASCTPYERAALIVESASEYRQFELISRRTEVAAENWADRELG